MYVRLERGHHGCDLRLEIVAAGSRLRAATPRGRRRCRSGRRASRQRRSPPGSAPRAAPGAPRPLPAVTWAGMSRHEITVSSGTGTPRARDELHERRLQLAVPGAALLEARARGRRPRSRRARRARDRPSARGRPAGRSCRTSSGSSSGCTSSFEPPHHERLEVAGEKVGQVEGRRAHPPASRPMRRCRRGSRSSEHPAGARRCVAPARCRGARRCRNRRRRRRRARSGPASSVSFASTAPAICSGVEWSFAGRQRTSTCVQPLRPDHGEHLAGDRAAGEDQHVGRGGCVERDLGLDEIGAVDADLGCRQGLHRAQFVAVARRASTSACAVSAATAASRQYASAPTALPNSSFSGAPPTSTM